MAGYTTSRAGGEVKSGGSTTEHLGSTAIVNRGRWLFYELRSKTWANRLNRRPRAYARGLPFKCKSDPNGNGWNVLFRRGGCKPKPPFGISCYRAADDLPRPCRVLRP